MHMTNIQIRDVPDEVHAELVRRADAAGQSLQQYLSSELTAIVKTPTLNEVLDQIEAHATAHISASGTVEAIRAERDRR